MEEDERISFIHSDSCSRELRSIVRSIINRIATEGVRPNPNDASAYWLLDQVTECEEVIDKFLSTWTECDVSTIPNAGNGRLYYLSLLYKKYRTESISQVVKNLGIVDAFRDSQLKSGRIQIDDSTLHGLGFRGLISVAPNSDAAQEGIKSIEHRYERDYLPMDERIMATSALGLLEYRYEKFCDIIDSVTERVISDITPAVDWRTPIPDRLLLVQKHPEFGVSNPWDLISRIYSLRRNLEEWGDNLNIAAHAEAGIPMLFAGDGPMVSKTVADWETGLREQRKGQQSPAFLSTQPTTAVKDRKIEIKQQMEKMIRDTTDSLYICTRGIGILYHDILDLIEECGNLDFKLLTNRQRAKGDRKKFKRAAMDELAQLTGKGVKQSELLHTRMMISDEKRLLVSNADITRDQLYDSFNAGLYTEDPSSVSKAVKMFDTAWESGEYLNH